MNEPEKKILRYIRKLRPIILQDGRLDIVETAASSHLILRGTVPLTLIRRGGKICPVEVKSSRYAAHASLDKFRALRLI